MAMELASCGYIVFVLDHQDGTCCYTKKTGPYDPQARHDFDLRSKQLDIRVHEVLSLSEEIYKADFFRRFGIRFMEVQISTKLVLFGHSFGGITVLRSLK